jgi:uncharacterized protein YjbJ (UPF0337 family)
MAFGLHNLCENHKEVFMNSDQFKGGWKQFKGELKQKWGQLTDDDLTEAEGSYDKFLGVVQKRYGDRKDEVKQWADDWYSKNERDDIRSRQYNESINQK